MPLLLALTVACASVPVASSPPSAPGRAIDTARFAPELQVDLEKSVHTRLGSYYQDIVKGTGAAALAGDHILVRYEARLPDGTVVDGGPMSAPLTVVLGPNVVRGWLDAIPGLRVGGLRRIVLPPELAYGQAGSPALHIPPSVILVFDIELLAVRPP